MSTDNKTNRFVPAGYKQIEGSSTYVASKNKVEDSPEPVPENEVNIILHCTKDELQSLQTGVWQLGSTEKEDSVSNWVVKQTQEGTSLLSLFCFENEDKILHHDLLVNGGHTTSYAVHANAKGSNVTNAEFIPVKLAVQVEEGKLAWATSGYYYHFIDGKLEREYKIIGKDRWAFQATRSNSKHLTDEPISKHHYSSLLLPYRIEKQTISEQHILFREIKLTTDELASVDSAWLNKNASKLNLENIVATRQVKLLDRKSAKEESPKSESLNTRYIVQLNPTTSERESWPDIADKHNLSAKELLDLNPTYHDDPMRLKVGDNLLVSKAAVYEPTEISETPSPIARLSDVHPFGDVWGQYNQREIGGKAINIFSSSTINDHVPLLNVCQVDVPEQFSLGWMQNDKTQDQQQLWEGIFTENTDETHKQLIKKYNAHLNDPVRQGEIIILPTAEPENDSHKHALNELIEEAQAASKELGKLNEEQVTTANRYFELLDYYASEALRRIKSDGLPSDEYAYASVGLGAVASGVGKHLENINKILLDINNLYVAQVALGSRSGGINYGLFVKERAALFKKLDGSFAKLSSRSIQLPINQRIRRALSLSTKSIVHNADEIIAKGFVPNLGKRMANVAYGIFATKGVGHVGLVLGGASGAKNIYDACSVNSKGECGKTTSREVGGFIGGWSGGVIGGKVAVAGTILALGVVGVASAPVIAIASLTAFIVGGVAGGILGATAGKATGDFFYETTIDLKESAEEQLEEFF